MAGTGPGDAELFRLAQRVGRRLLARDRMLVTAESCTGGWVARALTDVAGSSGWLECGYVTYSNAAKMRDLAVPARTLARHGAVSEPTVRAMARGALLRAGVQAAVAVSGVAGPGGGSVDKPVGLVWFCVAVKDGRRIRLVPSMRRFRGDREAVRRKAVRHALRQVLALS